MNSVAAGRELLCSNTGDKEKDILIKFKEGPFILAFRENLMTEQKPTSVNFPSWNFLGLWKMVTLPERLK